MIKLIVSAILVVIASIIMTTYFVLEDRKEIEYGIKNLQNWDKIKINMDDREVIAILGEPMKRATVVRLYETEIESSDSVFFYQMPPNYSLDGAIWFKSNINSYNKVVLRVLAKSPNSIDEYKYRDLLKKNK
jgi:hypothetical protein